MEKNYYEILEVDKNASKEIIDKAYKTLAKKYHPDLQEGQSKKENEEKMKLINEAYSVLSDETRKNTYDEQLQNSMVSQEEYQKILQENMVLRQEVERLTENISTNNLQEQYINRNDYDNLQNQYNQRINTTVRQAYQDIYAQNMQKRGYRFKYKDTVKVCIRVVVGLFCITVAILIIMQIPFVKTYFARLYENNVFVKAIVNTFVNTFKQLF